MQWVTASQHTSMLALQAATCHTFCMQGAVAALTPDSLDVLCHAAVRARNSGVLLACCYDMQEYAQLKALEGKQVTVSVSQVRHQATLLYWPKAHHDEHTIVW